IQVSESLLSPIHAGPGRDYGLCHLAARAAREGNTQEALVRDEQIHDDIFRDRCFMTIAGLRAANGDMALVRMAVTRYEQPLIRYESLMDIGVDAIIEDSKKIPTEIFDLAFEAALSIQDKEKRIQSITDVARRRSFLDPDGVSPMLPYLQNLLKTTS